MELIQMIAPLESIRTVSAADFRETVGTFPTGVAIVSAWDSRRSEPLGVTVSSFSSVSLEPPLILFSLSRSAHSLPAWSRAAGYAVNVLSYEQESLSAQFARPLTEKWDGVNYQRGLYDSPLLAGAVAWLECRAYRQYEGGDHIIFIGQVCRLHRSENTAPLVFHRGRYASLACRGT